MSDLVGTLMSAFPIIKIEPFFIKSVILLSPPASLLVKEGRIISPPLSPLNLSTKAWNNSLSLSSSSMR